MILKSLKFILAAMVTAGLTQGGLNGLASTSSILPRVDPIFQVGGHGSLQMGAAQSASMVQASGFLERLPAHLISGVTSTFVNGALSGGDPTILRNAAFGALATAVSTEASLAIGASYAANQMPEWAHKFNHGVVGCVAGALATAGTDSMGKGCAAGAIGAVAGEVAGEAYFKTQVTGLVTGGVPREDVIRQTTNVGRFAGGIVAAAIGGDVNIGAQMAGVAVENNTISSLVPLMVVGAYVTYEGEGDPVTGLKKLGAGEDTVRKAIADGTAEMVKVTYKSFPEAVETTAQAVTAFDDYVLGPTVTFLDTITGQIFSRRWNSYSKDEQNLIKGSAIAAGASVSFVSLYSVATKEIFKIARNISVDVAKRKGKNGPTNRATHEKYLDFMREKMEKPYVKDERLSELMDKLYRKNAEIGSGSTAAAVRYEQATGLPVKGRFHYQKSRDDIRALERWLKNNPNANAGDRAAAENVIRDMQNAFEGN